MTQASPLGDVERLSRIFSRHEDVAYRVALRILGEPADAQDAVQDAFLQTVRVAQGHGAPPREPDRIASWLLRVVTNSALGHLRRRQPAVTLSPEQLAEGFAAPARGEPARIFEGRETRQEVFRALLDLPDQQLAVLTLREYQGLSYGEIGETLALTPAAVKALLFRARDSFKTIYGLPRASHEPPACLERVRLLVALAEDGATAAWRSYSAHRRTCRPCIKAGVGRRRRLRQLRALLALLAAPGAWLSASPTAQAAALSVVPTLATGGVSGALTTAPGVAVAGTVIAASFTMAVAATPLVADRLPPALQEVPRAEVTSTTLTTEALSLEPDPRLPSMVLLSSPTTNPAPELETVAQTLRAAPDAPVIEQTTAPLPLDASVEPVLQSIELLDTPAGSAAEAADEGETQQETDGIPARRLTNWNPAARQSSQPSRSGLALSHFVTIKPRLVQQAKPVGLQVSAPKDVAPSAQYSVAPSGAHPGQAENDEPPNQASQPPDQANQPPGQENRPESPQQADEIELTSQPPGQAVKNGSSGQADKSELSDQATRPPSQAVKEETLGLSKEPQGQPNQPGSQAVKTESPDYVSKSQPAGEATKGRSPSQTDQASGPTDKAQQASKSQSSVQSSNSQLNSQVKQVTPKPTEPTRVSSSSSTTRQSIASTPSQSGSSTPLSSSNQKPASKPGKP